MSIILYIEGAVQHAVSELTSKLELYMSGTVSHLVSEFSNKIELFMSGVVSHAVSALSLALYVESYVSHLIQSFNTLLSVSYHGVVGSVLEGFLNFMLDLTMYGYVQGLIPRVTALNIKTLMGILVFFSLAIYFSRGFESALKAGDPKLVALSLVRLALYPFVAYLLINLLSLIPDIMIWVGEDGIEVSVW